ncbi:hypothetical protein TL16_g06960 [Triparma laevis f. inornata]|nr:hypothetical protein TL16_g06960 [Triparma laevis f. inornata]
MSIEIKMRFKSFEQDWARVFDFRNSFEDSISLMNFNHCFGSWDAPRISWEVSQGSKKCEIGDNSTCFSKGEDDHIVFTVKGNTAKIYKNGVLGLTSADGLEPLRMKRHFHTIGAMVHSSAATYGAGGSTCQHVHGNVSYFRMFDGIELTSEDVDKMYSRNDEFN